MSTPETSTSSSRKGSWQFSLLTLLVAMAWVAVACIALRTPNDLWLGIVFGITIIALLSAALMIVYRTARKRAFAVGFLIFGCGYLALALGTDGSANPYGQPQFRLPTARLGATLYSLLHGNESQSVTLPSPTPIIMRVAPGSPIPPPPTAAITAQVRSYTTVAYSIPGMANGGISLTSFLDVFHYELVIMLGIVGGIVAQFLYATQAKDEIAPK